MLVRPQATFPWRHGGTRHLLWPKTRHPSQREESPGYMAAPMAWLYRSRALGHGGFLWPVAATRRVTATGKRLAPSRRLWNWPYR